MVKSQFEKLLSKITVGALELPNRIIFGSHPTNFAKGNLLTDQHIAYYGHRAKGGAGMIVLEEQLVHPSDLPYEKATFGYHKEIVPGYRRVADAVHQYGAVVVAQLNHSGMQSEGSTSMKELWAPSAVPDVVSREVPKAMEEQDIREVIEGFAKVAGHVAEGGLDGVEINAAQFSLVRQFMSPLTNHRGDSYGGDLTNRLSFCVEILQSVRKELGKDKILGIKLCGDEFAPWGGLTPEDAVVIAQELEKLNLLDYITVSVGSLYSLHLSMATNFSQEGLSMDVASKIKAAVKLPVFAEGRIHRPDYAAAIIEEGKVDGVSMNRALIADPELPAKLIKKQTDSIRECISCNQGCQARRSMGKPLACLLNPLVGIEAKEDKHKLYRTTSPKQVLVVGGGPAGMEAARVAALRGHQVSLWEANSSLGGALSVYAQFVPELTRVIETWKKELDLLQVWVVTDKESSVEDILSQKPDVLVLATGSRDVKSNFNVKNCQVKTAREVVSNQVEGGKTILFWDEIGDQLMARTVEKLLAAGNKIYFVTHDLFPGDKLAGTMELNSWNPRLMNDTTEIFPLCKIKEINGTQGVIVNKYSGKTMILSGIDTFVYNCWPKPNDGLYQTIKEQVKEVYRVGDCLAPRGIGPAVREGYMVGRIL